MLGLGSSRGWMPFNVPRLIPGRRCRQARQLDLPSINLQVRILWNDASVATPRHPDLPCMSGPDSRRLGFGNGGVVAQGSALMTPDINTRMRGVVVQRPYPRAFYRTVPSIPVSPDHPTCDPASHSVHRQTSPNGGSRSGIDSVDAHVPWRAQARVSVA